MATVLIIDQYPRRIVGILKERERERERGRERIITSRWLIIIMQRNLVIIAF